MGIECATQLRVYTEDREVIRRNMLVAETLGLFTAGEVHVCAGAGKRHGLEYPGTLQVSPLRDGDPDVLRAYAGKIVLDAHQLGRVWIRQRVQQRGVDHAIDRGGGSDAQRHGGDRNERESRRSQKHANRVPQVEEQILDEGQALLGVMVFPYRFGRAELECGLAPRLGGRHTGAHVLLRLERKMFGDLFLQALVGTPLCHEIRQAYRRGVVGISCQVLRFDFEKASDDRRGLLPIAGLCLQLPTAGRC